MSDSEPRGVDPGQIVAVPGGFVCQGCQAVVRRLWRLEPTGPNSRLARCARCRVGLSPRSAVPIAVQHRLGL